MKPLINNRDKMWLYTQWGGILLATKVSDIPEGLSSKEKFVDGEPVKFFFNENEVYFTFKNNRYMTFRTIKGRDTGIASINVLYTIDPRSRPKL